MADYKKPFRSNGPSSRPYGAKPSFGGKPSFGAKPFAGKGGFAQKELYDAECNSCHERCQVPFRPNGKKPVYCSKCFNKDDSRSAGSASYADRGAPSYGPRSDFKPRPSRNEFTADVPNRQMEELTRKVDAMSATLQSLVVTVDTFNRATALTKEIRKHFPAEASEAGSKPAAAKTKPAKKPAKKTVKKAAKK